MRYPDDTTEGAHRLYRIALQHNFTRGRRTAQVGTSKHRLLLRLVCLGSAQAQSAEPHLPFHANSLSKRDVCACCRSREHACTSIAGRSNSHSCSLTSQMCWESMCLSWEMSSCNFAMCYGWKRILCSPGNGVHSAESLCCTNAHPCSTHASLCRAPTRIKSCGMLPCVCAPQPAPRGCPWLPSFKGILLSKTRHSEHAELAKQIPNVSTTLPMYRCIVGLLTLACTFIASPPSCLAQQTRTSSGGVPSPTQLCGWSRA